MQKTAVVQLDPCAELDAAVAAILGWRKLTSVQDRNSRSKSYYGIAPDGLCTGIPAYSTTWSGLGSCLTWCKSLGIDVELSDSAALGASAILYCLVGDSPKWEAVSADGVDLPHAVARAVILVQQLRADNLRK